MDNNKNKIIQCSNNQIYYKKRNNKMDIDYKILTDLPKQIIEIAKQYTKLNDLLTKDISDMYEVKFIKPKIEEKIFKYKSFKALCSIAPTQKVTVNYDANSGIKTNCQGSKVENQAIKQLDSIIWLNDFTDAMLQSAVNLTLDEATYIVYSFFYHEKESNIAEDLAICKQTLQKIKKSALVKIYYNLQYID